MKSLVSGYFARMCCFLKRNYFLAVGIFFLLHALRDYLQIAGVKNWFTEMGHFFDLPKYEIHSVAISFVVGLVLIITWYSKAKES